VQSASLRAEQLVQLCMATAQLCPSRGNGVSPVRDIVPNTSLALPLALALALGIVAARCPLGPCAQRKYATAQVRDSVLCLPPDIQSLLANNLPSSSSLSPSLCLSLPPPSGGFNARAP